MATSEAFLRLSELLGGFDPLAVESFFYANNPLVLKHWTMNIVELLMCVGAVLAFIHAAGVLRRTGDPTNLCYCVISVAYVFVLEVPIYFPDLFGGDPNNLYFLHNEFTAGLLYDRTPVYIVALYPALTYPAFVLIERTGVFSRNWGLLPGAISVGFVHHCFYEIFDQFGPQYGWWVWNYPLFNATVASVPLASVFTFAFMGPACLTLVTRLLITPFVRRRASRGVKINRLHLIVLSLLAPFLVLIGVVFTAPDTWYQILLGGPPAPTTEKIVSFSLLAVAACVTIAVCVKGKASRSSSNAALAERADRYPRFYGYAFLTVFAALWMYALPEYSAAVDGLTGRSTPIGSLGYAIGCLVLCMVFLALDHTRIKSARA